MKASETQIAGQHYKDFPIQPAEFCQRNRLNWCEANVVKYVCRHAEKKGAEDLRKAKHYIDLLLEWEYPAAPTDALVKDATAASLCHTCQRNKGCIGDYPRTKDGGCEGYIPEAKQEAPTAAEQPIDFTLPSIALKCTAEEAKEKYRSELGEWALSDDGCAEELIERWDCLQAIHTFYERGGDVGYYQRHVRVIMEDLTKMYAEGRAVMGAKADMLIKNARRGYYRPEVNAEIIASYGHSFAPKEADA